MAGPDNSKNDIIAKAKSTATGIADDLPPRHKLPDGLQKIVNEAEKDESLYDELWDGTCVSSSPSSHPSSFRTISPLSQQATIANEC